MTTMSRRKPKLDYGIILEAALELSPAEQRRLRSELAHVAGVQLVPPSGAPAAMRRGQRLAKSVRAELAKTTIGSLNGTMREPQRTVVVVIDTDVVLLAFAFQNDPRQSPNSRFLNKVQSAEPAITVYNLMEILGQLSFNLSAVRLAKWQSWLIEAYQLAVIWPVEPIERVSAEAAFRTEIFERPFDRMRERRMAFMDALVLGLAERTPAVDLFVTWNARHFKNKSSLAVLTPEEYLKQIA